MLSALLLPPSSSASSLLRNLQTSQPAPKCPWSPPIHTPKVGIFCSVFPFQCAMWPVSCCPRNCHGHPGSLHQGTQGLLIRLTGVASLHRAELAWGFLDGLLRLGHSPPACPNLLVFLRLGGQGMFLRLGGLLSQTSVITANITLIEQCKICRQQSCNSVTKKMMESTHFRNTRGKAQV